MPGGRTLVVLGAVSSFNAGLSPKEGGFVLRPSGFLAETLVRVSLRGGFGEVESFVLGGFGTAE
jgi:hypothetical protein